MSTVEKESPPPDLGLNLPLWATVDEAERVRLARGIAQRFPEFRFEGIGAGSPEDQRHRVAFFSRSDALFALIPGGEATLGYDAENPWVPSVDEQTEWDESPASEHFGSLEGYVAENLSPIRRVHLAPFLLEVEARPVGERYLQPDDPAINRGVVEGLIPGIGATSRQGIEYRLDRDGTLRARQTWPVSHAEACSLLTANGFRLPTSDEWEYACGAGSRTLFHWGDHSPSAYYSRSEGPPLFESWGGLDDLAKFAEQAFEEIHEIQDRRAEWDNPSMAPNAFGLFMTGQEVRREYCHEPDIFRASDGGEGACGGMDLFTACWLPLATAYIYRVCENDRGRGHLQMSARRCFPLG